EEAENAAVDGSDSAEAVKSNGSRSLLRESMFAIIPLLSLVVASFACFYLSGRSTILSGDDAAKIATAREFNFESFRACIGEADASIALFQAALFACVASFIMCVASGKLTASQASQAWLSGVKSLCFTFVILILAWSLSACISKTGLGTANFLVTSLSSNTPTFILPSFIFVLAAIVSFATGTSYGTMAIITPLAIPFAHELLPGDHAYLVAATSAVLTGAIFGDHCSPISDTTILSSTSARCGLLEHVSTQLGYALWIAGISIVFGFLPVGLGVSLKIALPVSLVACLALIFILGRKVPVKLNDEQE
ncbi:MAG: Na+/H+ antiporter NhaC family protein, partial [Thermoguttaceae bacterium]